MKGMTRVTGMSRRTGVKGMTGVTWIIRMTSLGDWDDCDDKDK